jgi:DNA-binding SARP family transcriptional activator
VLFNVLGPLEVRAGVAPTEFGRKPGTLLSLLLLNANAWVRVDQIIDALWGEVAPPSANGNVKTYVWQLRRCLPPAPDGPRVEGHPGGYRIRIGPGELDALVLEDLARDGRRAMDKGDPERAAQHFGAALRLWRGVPHPELPAGVAGIATARLEELRWEVCERLADALVARGRYVDAVALLQPLTAEDQLREGLWVRLICALSGAGRRGEALAAYQRARRLLHDELGVDPGPELQEVQRQVLTGELLTTPATTLRAQPQVSRRSYLPRDIPDFMGRAAEVDALLAAGEHGDRALRVAVVDGMAGVGKTTLALHVAHRLMDRYPDGQLLCDLRGHSARSGPVEPAEALASLLRAFGVKGAAVPADVEERAALWRATLADRRVLIVLDDAASAAQVRPLLPGDGGSLVLVTSRSRLAGLDGVDTLTLDVLSDLDALALFAAGVGDRRVYDEPSASAEVVRLCGHLPLAVRIAAGRLRQRRAWSVAALADRMRDDDGRLTELQAGDRDLSAMFRLSYQRLDGAGRRMFRLLGLAPCQEIDVTAAAALAGIGVDEAESLMEQLLDEHLLMQRRQGWYRVHDLLHGHARQTALEDETVPQRQAAVARLTRLSRGRAVSAVARTA